MKDKIMGMLEKVLSNPKSTAVMIGGGLLSGGLLLGKLLVGPGKEEYDDEFEEVLDADLDELSNESDVTDLDTDQKGED